MAAPGMSFREVKNSHCVTKWKDISVPLGDGGAAGSYLQDQKSVSRAGGYSYRDSGRVGSPARNRFIYWRTYQDVLELEEVSLDLDLQGASVRFRFQGASIISDINIHESHGNVVLLVATTTSVHRLMFPHPNRLQKYDNTYLQGAEKTIASIFTDASVVRATDPGNTHNYNQSGVTTAHVVHTSASWFTADAEAIFALATATGSILLVKLPVYGMQGIVTQHELKQSSMMHRLWTGIVPSVIRGGSGSEEVVTSLVLHPMGQDTYVFAISRDHKIRMWSCKTYECVMASDLLEYLPNNWDPNKLVVGDEGHILKKSVASSVQVLYLGVFMSFADRCQFCVVQPVMADGRYQLTHQTTVFGPQDDLLDFALTESHLWALWTTSQAETFATCASIEYNRPSIQSLQPVTMETPEPSELEVPGHLEPREYYLEQVFCPGRFSSAAVIKALNIFKRSLDASQMPDALIPPQALRAEVMAAVEQEIQANASDINISEEEYQNLQLQQWAKFYSCCVQYHERDTKPIGMFADNETGLVGVIKKSTTSVFRPCDSVDHLSLTPVGECHVEHFESNCILWEDEAVFRDVIALGDTLKLVRLCLSDDYVYSFEQELYHTQDPRAIAENIVQCLLTDTEYVWTSTHPHTNTHPHTQNPRAITENIVQCLLTDTESADRRRTLRDISLGIQQIQDLGRAVESVVELLDLVQKPLADDDMGVSASRQLSLARLFSSTVGTRLLARSVQQTAQTRLDLSRDLLLLLTMTAKTADQTSLPHTTLSVVQSELLSKAAVLVQAYYVLKWSSQVLVTNVTINQVDANMRLLEALGILDALGSVPAQKINDAPSPVLLELFLMSEGGERVKDFLSYDALYDDDPCSLWSKGLLPFVTSVCQILWPYNNTCVFAEFLLSHCQYTVLEEYVRLTQDWCEVNKYSHRVFSALSQLSTGSPHKALECFLEVPLGGVAAEPFLSRLTGDDTDAGDDVDARVVYLLKVLGVFEQRGFPHLAVSIAREAINVAGDREQYVATLWSKVFKNELEMGHNEEAYNALLANPDKDRRRDCLRQFLVVLCDRSELQTLVSLPYRDRHVVLEEEVVSILEARARSIDLTKHNYYDLLYAFHVYRQNYRKAGTVMYEYGMRLGRELLGVKGLQKQAKCYLAALNALRLVTIDYAWIVKPAAASDEGGVSPEKRGRLSKSQLVVLELEDIEREYMLVHARLQLLQKAPDTAAVAGSSLSASETIGLLVNVGLFDSAINICKMFSLPLTPVFEILASRCVNLSDNSSGYMTGDNEYTSEAWSWLQQNDLPTTNTARETGATEHAWRLLQTYLLRYHDNTTQYHRTVAIKFLSQGFTLPPWLTNIYKEKNAPELLRLYLDYDLLEDASELTLEYIDAVLGKGREYYGLKTYLHAGAPAVWLPYTSIDQLLAALDTVETEPRYKELHHDITARLDEYFVAAQQVSADHLQYDANKTAMINRPNRSGVLMMET